MTGTKRHIVYGSIRLIIGTPAPLKYDLQFRFDNCRGQSKICFFIDMSYDYTVGPIARIAKVILPGKGHLL